MRCVCGKPDGRQRQRGCDGGGGECGRDGYLRECGGREGGCCCECEFDDDDDDGDEQQSDQYEYDCESGVYGWGGREGKRGWAGLGRMVRCINALDFDNCITIELGGV